MRGQEHSREEDTEERRVAGEEAGGMREKEGDEVRES